MSDMEQSDVVDAPEAEAPENVVEAVADADAAPVAEAAPETPPAAEPAVEAPVSGPSNDPNAQFEPTAEELQAEIAVLQAEVAAQEEKNSAAVQEPEAEAPQPEPVVVIARTPSSESPTQEPEEDKPFSVEEAARVVVTLVRAHRTIGDADLDAAIAALDAEYPAESEPEQA